MLEPTALFTMRSYLVKFAGLALHIIELQRGTLALKHGRPESQPREYILNEEDFEDSADSLDDYAAAALASGLNASAVGLQLCLIKNDGNLKVSFQGKNGGWAEWTFRGMKIENGSRMIASAFTKTENNPTQCSVCGEERETRSGVSDEEVQTDTKQSKDSASQTDGYINRCLDQHTAASTQTDQLNEQLPTSRPSKPQEPSPGTPLKRKAQADPDDQPPLHKRAKSTHNSSPLATTYIHDMLADNSDLQGRSRNTPR